MQESFSEQGALPSVTAEGSYQACEVVDWETVAEQEVCVLHALQWLRQQGPPFSHDKDTEVPAMPVFQHCPSPTDHRNKLIDTQWGFNAMVARGQRQLPTKELSRHWPKSGQQSTKRSGMSGRFVRRLMSCGRQSDQVRLYNLVEFTGSAWKRMLSCRKVIQTGNSREGLYSWETEWLTKIMNQLLLLILETHRQIWKADVWQTAMEQYLATGPKLRMQYRRIFNP